jgi:hypothetical protein
MSRNFLDNYCLFASGNEAPPKYHIWCGLSALSACIGRRVWIEQGIFYHAPNLYVTLVGEPGNGKTTAMQIAMDLAMNVGDIAIAATSMTKEGLVTVMTEDDSGCKKSTKMPDGKIAEWTQMAIFATELTHFIAVNPLGMIDFFTTIYDQKVYKNVTKNKGRDHIPGPYITLLACMTPDLVAAHLKGNIIGGGFARRNVFVIGGPPGAPQAFPVITTEQAMAYQECVNWGKKLRTAKGPFTWTQAAIDWYTPWYNHQKTVIVPNLNNPAMHGWMQSKHVQMMKVAMLLSLADSLDLVLDRKHLETALSIINDTEIDMPRIFEGAGRNPLAPSASRVMEQLIRNNRPTPLKACRAMIWGDLNWQEQNSVFSYLVETQRAVKLVDPNGVEYIMTPEVAAVQRVTSGAATAPPVDARSQGSSQGPVVIDLFG